MKSMLCRLHDIDFFKIEVLKTQAKACEVRSAMIKCIKIGELYSDFVIAGINKSIWF